MIRCFALVLLVGVLTIVPGWAGAQSSRGLQPYGLNGRLSQRQLLVLLYLRFPQSYGAIKGRLGVPAYREGQRDYYGMPNGNLVVIYYNFQGYAMGYRFGDSGRY